MARAKSFDTYIDGLNQVLRAFKALPKEASAELRRASKVVAERHMVPAWQEAAINYAGPWGDRIAESIRARSDRLPAVDIGYKRKVFSGGASSIMVRYPSHSGEAGDSFAPFQKTLWMEKAKNYKGPALQEWSQAVDRVDAKWSTL